MENAALLEYKRKSFMQPGNIYFWTATINSWQHLLQKDKYKNIIISCLQYLSNAGKIDVFAFIIMPNHIHLIWRINEMNGKETAQASFTKYTAHAFKKMLSDEDPDSLSTYAVDASNKAFEFWQRDSLAIHLYTQKVAFQKLDYIHYNPCTKRWQLVQDPSHYFFSSAKYYMEGKKEFAFLKDLRDEF